MPEIIIRNLVDLADVYGCDARPEAVAKALYKSTECGASLCVREWGVEIGSIIEGSDAEVVPVPLCYPFSYDTWESTVKHVEDCADELWNDAHAEDEG